MRDAMSQPNGTYVHNAKHSVAPSYKKDSTKGNENLTQILTRRLHVTRQLQRSIDMAPARALNFVTRLTTFNLLTIR